MIDLDGWIAGSRLPDAWVGGLSDSYTVVAFGETYGSIDLQLDPLGAYRLLGFPLPELTGACVSLEDRVRRRRTPAGGHRRRGVGAHRERRWAGEPDRRPGGGRARAAHHGNRGDRDEREAQLARRADEAGADGDDVTIINDAPSALEVPLTGVSTAGSDGRGWVRVEPGETSLDLRS